MQSHALVRFVSIAILFGVLAGCAQGTASPSGGGDGANTVSSRMAAEYDPARKEPAAAPATQPAATRRSSRPIATVNDESLSQADFFKVLMDARGVQVLQLLLIREVARQEAAKQGLTVTAADIDEEYCITARAEHLDGKDVGAMTEARREHIIDEWSRSRGVSRAELAIAIEKQAILRKIVAKQVESATFSDEQIERAYRLEHGEKLLLRHIQFSNERVYEQIEKRLANGDRFEDLVADYSQNVLTKMQQGLMQPLSPDDPTVPMLTKAAMQLEPGGVSNPIELDGYFHVLKLEKRIPADGTPIESVREELVRNMRAQLVNNRIEELGRRLLLSAKLRIDDRPLANLYGEMQRAGRIEGPPLIGQ